jgi:hypothetical protein
MDEPTSQVRNEQERVSQTFLGFFPRLSQSNRELQLIEFVFDFEFVVCLSPVISTAL